MRVVYFTNQYPAVSHTFIRREIHALETLGVTIIRYALWSSAESLVDVEDKDEFKQTRYILKAGIGEFLRALFSAIIRRPFALLCTFWLAIKIGKKSDRGIMRHFAYIAEAIVLAYWCQRDRVQHVHAHFGTNSAAVAMLAGQLSKIPYSFTAHGSEEFEKAPLLSLDVKLSNAAFAVCVSSFGRSQLMRWSTPDQWKKITLVHCGVDARFLDIELPKPTLAPRLVCVGRLGEHKAQLVLIAAARRLRDCGTILEVVLVGDGPMRPVIEEAIREARLENTIFITGWLSGERVKAEIIAARALVLPSFSENMPVVIMEAMALGRPVISTYIAGIPELVQPGKNGWLVPASDELALAKAMSESLTAPMEKLASMGISARAQIIERHDALKEATKIKELFESSNILNA